MLLTFNEYQIAAFKTALYTHDMYPWTSLIIEASELADLMVKPRLRGDDKWPTDEEIISEAGDVLWNLACLLKDRGISLQEVAEYNVNKLHDRAERGVIQGSGDNR